MALTLGKLGLIVGAGLVGSVLAKEGRASSVSDFCSGAFKIVLRQLKQDEKTTSSSKPRNDSLMQQVNSLREELQLLASNRSVTIVTGNRSASGKYGVVVIVVVVGYGYLWWKGWKLPDMMFATRRGLNEACSSVAKQLDGVYSSVSATKKHLSSRIDRVDCKIEECADNTSATKEEVTELRGDVKMIGSDVQSVHHVVRSLENKISRIEGKQNEINYGVGNLLTFVGNLGSTRSSEQIEGSASSSSRPALEMPRVSPSRAISLPANTSSEPPSPSTANGSQKKPAIFMPLNSTKSEVSPSTANGSQKKPAIFTPLNSTKSEVSSSGLKALYGLSDDVGGSGLSSPWSSNGVSAETNTESSSTGLFGRLFQRSRSAVQPSK